jgi:hypothetical protein
MYVLLVQLLVVTVFCQLCGNSHFKVLQDLLLSQHNPAIEPYRFSLGFEVLTNQYLGTKVNVSA